MACPFPCRHHLDCGLIPCFRQYLYSISGVENIATIHNRHLRAVLTYSETKFGLKAYRSPATTERQQATFHAECMRFNMNGRRFYFSVCVSTTGIIPLNYHSQECCRMDRLENKLGVGFPGGGAESLREPSSSTLFAVTILVSQGGLRRKKRLFVGQALDV